jgi:CO/xanthine dehydrogenase Mo-binding subunit
LTGSGDKPQELVPNAWIRIDAQDRVTVMVNHSEMGQGITTALAMIVAEELEADWKKVRAEIAPADPVYGNPAMMGVQATGGSTSVRTCWEVLRQAGAATRELLIAAAVSTWGVAAKECAAVNGTVVHQPTGRVLRYGQLLHKAASLPLPQNPTLKNPKEFKIIGKKFHRLDTQDKTNGTAIFGTDMRLPGMLTAVVLHPPVFGGKVKSVDASKARQMPGVRHVLPISAGVAVVADNFWHASKASEAVKVQWDPSEKPLLATDRFRARWAELAKEDGRRVMNKGDVDRAFADAAKVVEAVYELPFQAHACPEPMNCTAHIHDRVCDVWVPTQTQGGTQEIAAAVAGLDVDAVRIHTTFLGGGFGRRGEVDFVTETVELAGRVKAPVKVVWSREEDIRNDRYRPASYHVVRAALEADGTLKAFWHRFVGPNEVDGIIETFMPALIPAWVPRPVKNAASRVAIPATKYAMSAKSAATNAGGAGYAIDHIRVEYINDDPGVPVGAWRSVANSRNAFVVESFVDEIAAASGKDPYRMRHDLLKTAPKLRGVLELAATKAGWEKQLPAGVHRGIALDVWYGPDASHGTPVAMVAEASVNAHGVVRVHRVVAAVDCGMVINPKIVEAQISGGIAFGLTATIKSAITIKNGRAQQSNFHDFPILRLDEMPEVEVHIVPSSAAPTGIGEVGVPPIAPAVANAIASATGKRVRHLPIVTKDLA